MLPHVNPTQDFRIKENAAELFFLLGKEGVGSNWGNYDSSESLPLGEIGAAREFSCDYMRGNSKVFQPMSGVTIATQNVEVFGPTKADELLLYPSDKFYVAIVLNGTLGMTSEKESFSISKGQYLLYRQSQDSECYVKINQNEPLSLAYFAFSPERFEDIASSLKTPLPKIIRASEMLKLWGKERTITGEDPTLHRLAKSLVETCDYNELWPVFLKSKISELFCILNTLDSKITDVLVAPSQLSSLNRIGRVLNLFLEDHAQIPSSSEVSRILRIDKKILNADFEDVYGLNFPDYCNAIKFQLVFRKLLKTKIPITALAYWAGYNHTANFSRAFHKQFGLSPREVRLSAKNFVGIVDDQ